MPKQIVNKNLFDNYANKRKAEQDSIEKTLTGEMPSVGRGRPIKTSEPTTTMSIRITEKRKQAIKIYAVEHGTTISDMIAKFIDELDEKED